LNLRIRLESDPVAVLDAAQLVIVPTPGRGDDREPEEAPRIARLEGGGSADTGGVCLAPASPDGSGWQNPGTIRGRPPRPERMPMSVWAWATDTVGRELLRQTVELPAMRAGDVEVQVECCGLCHSDLHMLDGEWGPLPAPFVPGHEIVGRIVAVGEAVPATRLGERVGIGWQAGACGSCRECQRGRNQLCARRDQTCDGRPGGLAERVRAASDFAIPIPARMKSVDAAPLLCAGATVYGALRGHEVGPGSRVAVLGIGGLGHLALSIARAMGAEVVAVTTSPDKAAAARALGAQEVLDREGILARSQRGRFDLILQTAPAPLDVDAALNNVAPGGALCFVATGGDRPSFTPLLVLAGQRRISGSEIAPSHWIKDLLRLCDEADIRPMVEVLPMREHARGFAAMRRNEVRFRAVLVAEAAAGELGVPGAP
jgi:uncharacterized zinc-type alcohol dehydrogenase-like protein